jgi:hypothetical protein
MVHVNHSTTRATTMAAIDLYTRDELNKRISRNKEILTWAKGEFAWDVKGELFDYEEILRQMDERDEARSVVGLHSIGY